VDEERLVVARLSSLECKSLPVKDSLFFGCSLPCGPVAREPRLLVGLCVPMRQNVAEDNTESPATAGARSEKGMARR
jgi:hypothetical protein